MKYAIFNLDGSIAQVCNDDTLNEVPAGALEMTAEQFANWPNFKRSEDGLSVVEAAPTPPPPTPVPKAVTMRQARLALLQTGKLSLVNTAIASMPGTAGDAARIEWEYSQEVQRDKALVLSLAPVLGLDDQQLDALFLLAATL